MKHHFLAFPLTEHVKIEVHFAVFLHVSHHNIFHRSSSVLSTLIVCYNVTCLTLLPLQKMFTLELRQHAKKGTDLHRSTLSIQAYSQHGWKMHILGSRFIVQTYEQLPIQTSLTLRSNSLQLLILYFRVSSFDTNRVIPFWAF